MNKPIYNWGGLNDDNYDESATTYNLYFKKEARRAI